MSEDPQAPGLSEPGAGADAPAQVRTGVESVDAVIAAVEELEERPIEEHVGVFETAQEQLRRALDTQQPTPPAPRPPADRSQSS
jgi:hypothetical protein